MLCVIKHQIFIKYVYQMEHAVSIHCALSCALSVACNNIFFVQVKDVASAAGARGGLIVVHGAWLCWLASACRPCRC